MASSTWLHVLKNKTAAGAGFYHLASRDLDKGIAANKGRFRDSIDSLLGEPASLLLDAGAGNVKVVLFPMCIEHKVVGIGGFNERDDLVAVFMDELKGPLVSTKAAKQKQDEKIPSLDKFIAFPKGRDGWVHHINKAAKDSDRKYRILLTSPNELQRSFSRQVWPK